MWNKDWQHETVRQHRCDHRTSPYVPSGVNWRRTSLSLSYAQHWAIFWLAPLGLFTESMAPYINVRLNWTFPGYGLRTHRQSWPTSSSSFLACNSRLRSAICRHHPPQRAVLSQICCFGERKMVMFQILLDGAEPCDAGMTQLSSPVCRRGGQQDPLGLRGWISPAPYGNWNWTENTAHDDWKTQRIHKSHLDTTPWGTCTQLHLYIQFQIPKSLGEKTYSLYHCD